MEQLRIKNLTFRIICTASVLCFLSALIFGACGTARRGEPLRGTLVAKNERVKHGELVFNRNCQQCHPGGEAGTGPSLNNIPLPAAVLKFRVRSRAFLLGLGRMPSFKKNEIPNGDLNDLIRYLKALRKKEPGKDTEVAKK